MSNLLQFSIKLNDLFSATLRKVSSNTGLANKVFQQMENHQRKMQAAIGASAGSIDALNSKIEALKAKRNLLPEGSERQIRAINTEINNLTKNVNRLQTINGSKLKVWGKDALNQLPFAGLIRNPLVMGAAALGYSAKQGMDRQAQLVKFATLLGDDKKGSQTYKNLKGYADKTPYESTDVLKAGETLLNYGVADSKLLTYVKQLGDISGGSAERLQYLSLAFGQVSAKGHLAGQEVLQMVNAGFNPLQEISRTTGKSMDELSKMMEKGQISLAMVTNALQSSTSEGGRFYGMMDKLSNTLQGQLSTFMDKLKTVAADIGSAILPLLTQALSFLNIAVQKVVGLFSSLAKWVNANRNGLIALTAAVVAGYLAYKAYHGWQVLSYLWMMRTSVMQAITTSTTLSLTAATTALNAAFAISPIGWVVAGAAALVGVLTYLLKPMDETTQKLKQQNEEWKEFYDTQTVASKIAKTASNNIADNVAKATMLLDRMKTLGLHQKEYAQIRKELLGLDKEAFKNIIDQASAYNLGSNALANYTKKMFEHAEAMAAVEVYKDTLKETVKRSFDLKKKIDGTTYGKDETFVDDGRWTGVSTAYQQFVPYKDQKGIRAREYQRAFDKLKVESDNVKSFLKSTFIDKDTQAKFAISGIDSNGGIANAGGNNSNSGSSNIGKSIASGGPRVININGVKFMDKMENHFTGGITENTDTIEEKLTNLFLRILNSGATVSA